MSRVTAPSSGIEFKRIWQADLADYITALAWSASGSHLAACSSSGEIQVWQWPSAEPLLHYQDPQVLSTLAFAEDGRWLAAAGQRGQVLIWDLTSPLSQPQVQLSPVEAWIDKLVWQPTTHTLAFNVNRLVYLVDAPTQQQATTLDFQDSSVLGLAWHPQGTHLAACGHTGTKIWSATDWARDPYWLQVPGASLTAAWSQQGRYLATGNYDRTLSVLEWQSPPPWLMQGFPGKVRQLQWSDPMSQPDSDSPLLAAVCVEGVTVWHRSAQRPDVWHSRVLDLHKGFVQAIAFQPRHLVLASADAQGKLVFWQQADQPMQTVKGPSGGFSALSWHPGGRYLAAAGQEGEIWVLEESKTYKKGFG